MSYIGMVYLKAGLLRVLEYWNVLDFCNDNFQAWKVLERERKSWKTPGKIKTA